MTRWALAAGLWLLALSPAQAAGLAECAWSKLPDAVRHDYVASYSQISDPANATLKRNMDAAAQVLQKNNTTVLAMAAICIGRNDIPAVWERALVASQAIQAGSADEMSQMLNISRDALDATWAKAPATAVQCIRSVAAKAFGLVDEPCPDAKAPLWFLQDLKIDMRSNQLAAEQALIYFDAKAQGEWAEALISKFEALHPKPPS